MAYRVVLTEKAEADVDSILAWFHNQNAAVAGARWFAQLLAKLNTLETHPNRCGVAVESAELGQEIRELLLGRKQYKYRLLFRIDGKIVSILRVWRGARDAIARDDLPAE